MGLLLLFPAADSGISGSGAGTQAAATGSGTGAIAFTGTGAGSQTQSADGDGLLRFVGDGGQLLADDTLTILTADLDGAILYADDADPATQAAQSGTGSGALTFAATGAGTGAAATASGSGLLRFLATGSGTGAPATASGTGTLAFTSTGAGTQAAASGSGTGIERFTPGTIGDLSLTWDILDYQVVPFTLMARGDDIFLGYSATLGVHGSFPNYILTIDRQDYPTFPVPTVLASVDVGPVPPSFPQVPWTIRLQVWGDAGAVTLCAKAWKTADPEPGWQLLTTDDYAAIPRSDDTFHEGAQGVRLQAARFAPVEATQPAAGASGTGTVTEASYTGTGAGTQAAQSASGSGTVVADVTGTGDGTQAKQRGSGTGTVPAEQLEVFYGRTVRPLKTKRRWGKGAGTQGPATGSGSGGVRFIGSGAGIGSEPAAAGSGGLRVAGAGRGTVAVASAAGVAVIRSIGTGNGAQRRPASAGRGILRLVGSGSGTQAPAGAEGTGAWNDDELVLLLLIA